jgi:hypothetical protein
VTDVGERSGGIHGLRITLAAYVAIFLLLLAAYWKGGLQTMLQEHRVVVAALNNLADAPKKEKKMEIVGFTEKLALLLCDQAAVYNHRMSSDK